MGDDDAGFKISRSSGDGMAFTYYTLPIPKETGLLLVASSARTMRDMPTYMAHQACLFSPKIWPWAMRNTSRRIYPHDSFSRLDVVVLFKWSFSRFLATSLYIGQHKSHTALACHMLLLPSPRIYLTRYAIFQSAAR